MKLSEILTLTLLSVAFSESVLAKQPQKVTAPRAAVSQAGANAYHPLTKFRAG